MHLWVIKSKALLPNDYAIYKFIELHLGYLSPISIESTRSSRINPIESSNIKTTYLRSLTSCNSGSTRSNQVTSKQLIITNKLLPRVVSKVAILCNSLVTLIMITRWTRSKFDEYKHDNSSIASF